MSCYHPFAAWPTDELSEKGKRLYRIGGRYDEYTKFSHPGAIPIPCGRCIGCRLDYSRRWADRMMLELKTRGSGLFVTLTYNNDFVPVLEDPETGEYYCFTLEKRDLQLFMKRLRKYFTGRKLTFYAAGEYGKGLRPHYHLILFGISLEDFPDRVVVGKNELGQMYFSSPTFERIWKNGFIVLSDVNWKTCAYVARYVQKKIYSSSSVLTELYGAVPEFSTMSRNPGLGYQYLVDHPGLFEASQIFVSGKETGIQIPKYFLNKLKDEKFPFYDPQLYDIIVNARKEFSSDAELLKLQQTDLGLIEQLELEEDLALRRSTTLLRHI